jgi:myo-inositol-1(or 4)-monophosphatase
MSLPDPAWVETLARDAGRVLQRHSGRLAGFERKGRRDLVTVADREAEALILTRIRDRFPGHAILAEESAPDVAMAEDLWIVDPLDGTTNFVHGLPHVAVSIAWWRGGVPGVACVHNPLLDETYVAEAGGGAFGNGVRLRVREERNLAESLLCSGFSYRLEEHEDSNLGHWADFARRCRGLRRLGSAALDLCYLAAGRYDGFWELHLAPWDVAAGALVAIESGAVVSDRHGGGRWLRGGSIVAACAALHPRLLEVLERPG